MLDPSSSEESGEEVLEEEPREAPAAVGSQRCLPAQDRDCRNEKRSGAARPRPASPSPSVSSERDKHEEERLQKEKEERKTKLQIYVFVLRCIAYPFNAKQPTDMARRQQKVSASGSLLPVASIWLSQINTLTLSKPQKLLKDRESVNRTVCSGC